MKTKLYLLILVYFFLYLIATAQVPQGFNYQAVARDGDGNIITGQSLPVRITIQSDSLSGTIFWQEVHASVTTNDFGMLTLVIGKGTRQGTSQAATFDAIDWSVTPKFVMTEIDNGSGFVLMGSSRLWSVPYAINSKTNNPWLLNGSSLYYAGGYVGIETNTPVTPLTVTYNDNTGITYPLYIQNASGDWTATEKGVGLKFGRLNPASGHDYGTIRGTIASASGGDGRLQFIGGGGTDPHMTINHLGNVGIGTINPVNLFDVKVASNQHLGIRQANNNLSLGTFDDVGTSYVRLDIDALPLNLNAYSGGNVGIGTTTPAHKLHVVGTAKIAGSLILDNNLYAGGYLAGTGSINTTSMELGGPSPDATNGQATIFLHHHGAIAHQLRYTSGCLYLEAAGNAYGTTTTPAFLIGGSLYAGIYGGNIGIGTTTPTSKMVIQPPSDWDDNTPLFEVKNKYGVAVLAVYNNGVRINVEHNDYSKSVKGGFAIGGFDYAKASKTVDFMRITSDSVRFNINNKPSKAVKGGFAIGGYGTTKGDINEDFMYITPKNSGSGEYNTFLGYQSGYFTTTGYNNVFVGYKAGYDNTGPVPILYPNNGINNVYIGTNAGENNLGGNNILIGDGAGKVLTNGNGNVYLGSNSGIVDVNGDYNTYLGAYAGKSETGSDNVCIGYKAGFGSGESDYLAIGNRNNNGLITGQFDNEKLFLWADVGIRTGSLGGYQLYVAGNAYATTWTPSDIRWKKNISELDNILQIILQLKGVNYEWRRDEFPERKFDSGTQIGLIAQEVEKIYPQLVRTDDNGYKAVSYEKLSVVLLEGMKEQQGIIEQQQQQINRMEKLVQELMERY
jgi:hypothetical protein